MKKSLIGQIYMESLLSASTDLDTGDRGVVNKTGQICPHGAYLSSGGR